MHGVKGNSADGTGYSCEMKAMIASWREHWSTEPGTTSPSVSPSPNRPSDQAHVSMQTAATPPRPAASRSPSVRLSLPCTAHRSTAAPLLAACSPTHVHICVVCTRHRSASLCCPTLGARAARTWVPCASPRQARTYLPHKRALQFWVDGGRGGFIRFSIPTRERGGANKI